VNTTKYTQGICGDGAAILKDGVAMTPDEIVNDLNLWRGGGKIMDTLEDAKNEVYRHLKEGSFCPCCDQFAKVYRRKLTGTQSAGLTRLVKLYVNYPTYYHVSELKISGNGGEFAQLRRWGLIVQQINKDTGKRTSGMWKPTPKGMVFSVNATRVPVSCDTYNNETLAFSDEDTNIIQTLGERFNYAELMEHTL